MTNYDFFMATDLSTHIGKWIAICNEKIVSEGGEPKSVYKHAKKACPNKRILLTKVFDNTTMIF